MCGETEWSDGIRVVRAENEIGHAPLGSLFRVEGRSWVSQVGCPPRVLSHSGGNRHGLHGRKRNAVQNDIGAGGAPGVKRVSD